MRRHAFSWCLLLLCACYRKDPLYCDDKTPCPAGQTCRMPDHACFPPADLGMPPPPDLAVSPPGDMLPPPPPPDLSVGPASCTRNYQCPGSACDDNGACHDKTKVLVVDDDLAGCKGPGLPDAKPYCYIQDALSELGGHDVILVQPSHQGGHTNMGNFININTSVRLVGARSSPTAAQPVVLDPIVIKASGGANITVGIDDLEITPTKSGTVSGISCGKDTLGGTTALTVRWSQVIGAPNWGLTADNCTPVQLVSNVFEANGTASSIKLPAYSGGVRIHNATVTLFNNIIASNGLTANNRIGLFLIGNIKEGHVAFNTLADTACSGNMYGCNLTCVDDTFQPISALVDESIIPPVSGVKTIVGCTINRSVVPADYSGAGSNNITSVTPVFKGGGDYHLDPTASANKMLIVKDNTPAVNYDIDGDPRPAGAVYVGADQITP